MSCILRICGDELDIDALLSHHLLPSDRIWKKEDARSLQGKVHSDSGANFVVSAADLDEFTCQLNEATAYLEEHAKTIAALVTDPGVKFAALDFGVSLREGYVAQFSYFPPHFAQTLANVVVGLEASHYACSEDGAESYPTVNLTAR